ncbi:MAG: dihydropteridine reductase [Clostridia bacterium]|nr:dihydropteridine reductase [Clostridia bacterium]
MNRNDKSFMVEKIRTKYVEKKDSSLDELRKLDRKVKAPAEVFAYIFGSISALIMGAGMSLVMTDVANMLGLGDMTIPGIAVGVVGMVLAIVNYPIYKGILNSRKKKYSEQVIALSNKILSEEEKA